MASPNPDYSQILSTTIAKYARKAADNLTENIPLLTKLNMKGKVRPFDGGVELVHPVSYQENGTFKWYSGGEALDIAPTDTITAAKYPLKFAAVSTVMTGAETLQNAGRERVIDLAMQKIKDANRTMRNQISRSLFGDGTGNGGKAITGLAALVDSTPDTGVVGGINAANEDWWRNLAITADVDNATPSTAQDSLYSALRRMTIALTRDSDTPDLFACGDTAYEVFWSKLQDQQRFMGEGSKMAKAGVPGFPLARRRGHPRRRRGWSAGDAYRLRPELRLLVLAAALAP